MSRKIPQRVAFGLPVGDNESLPSLMARVAHHNVLGHPSILIERQWPPSNLSISAQNKLSVVVRSYAARIRSMFSETYQNGLHISFMTYESMRVAPAALQASPHHRWPWLIRPLGFCPFTWQRLIDACPGCRKSLKLDLAPLYECKSCGFDLREAVTSEVPKNLREGLATVATFILKQWTRVGVYDTRLPGPLAQLSGPQVFELIVLLAKAKNPDGIGEGGIRGTVPEEGLIDGLETLYGFPESLRRVADANENKIEPAFFHRLEVAAQARDGPLREMLDTMAAMRGRRRGVSRLKQKRVAGGKMTATQLAAALHIERSQLRTIIDAGVLGDREARGQQRRYDWFSEEDFHRAAAFVGGRAYASSWAKQTRVSPVVVRQLLGVGLLKLDRSIEVEQVFDKPQLTKASIDGFSSALLDRIQFSHPHRDWVPLHDAFTVIGGAHKPWAPVLLAALYGTFPHGLQSSGRYELKIGDLCIHSSVAWAFRMRALFGAQQFYEMRISDFGPYRPTAMTRTEAERYLNCYPADITRLIESGNLTLLSDNPASLCAASVETFGSRYVSTREIAAIVLSTWVEEPDRGHRNQFPRHEGFLHRADLHRPDGIMARLRAHLRLPRRVVMGPATRRPNYQYESVWQPLIRPSTSDLRFTAVSDSPVIRLRSVSRLLDAQQD
ncbi:MAG: hypothetical protein EON91_01545 [Brevundimonas sp.]|uniref:hypothetical protein n=1 Tax=Brevundimonas sp. TaxID=1871086 RepID=UPI00121BAB8F|nr:hypothetical protein [Brevundimonas sp.]RZJ19396.1 MAG: hypothetical protein EON91_01545 [Brevundimonas sp.]